MENTKKAIIIFGPPGAGKGTQANLLIEEFEFYHLETSKLLEKAFKNPPKKGFTKIGNQKYYFRDEKKLWDTGELNSVFFVLFLIIKQVEKVFKEGKNIIFTGSPRRVIEAEKLMPVLKKLYSKSNIKIFHLDLSAKQSVWRNSHRRICKLMRHPILYNKETIKLTKCPLDGSELIKRALDKPEIIKKRYKVYEEQTLPLIDYFKKQGFKVQRINGEQPVANVFKDILKKLE